MSPVAVFAAALVLAGQGQVAPLHEKLRGPYQDEWTCRKSAEFVGREDVHCKLLSGKQIPGGGAWFWEE
ncbi:hypothetical protein [Segniliparus rugosus]|uniref:Uncharacterized protein n=1 Tax=Segniliparus rugosus (strain ATCC BAA-974 / DSM 45345 / CCUG 50838 / CIP 108380 / JCM 13579 / CDC 945) TaxID=679197 RepID=E5XUG5_SEGRC|nr:hypothetical protein [Segniliparus rugosus]EFV12019.2 hypothetical protein HMPREF9336_03137 [Segniliparus rugosus ATCC BAA-974]